MSHQSQYYFCVTYKNSDIDRSSCMSTGKKVPPAHAQQVFNLRFSLFWVAVIARVGCVSADLVTLGCGISTLGIGASTLGMCIACHATWFARTLLRMVLAFAC